MTHRPLIPYVLGNCVAILGGIAIALFGLTYLDSTSFVDALIKDTDFLHCYSAGHLVITGHAGAVYNLTRLFAVEKWVTLPLHPRTVNPYPYPPFHALLISPLTLLPYDAAFVVWTAISALLLLFTLHWLEGYAQLSRRQALIARLLAVCSLPVVYTLIHGQLGLVMLAAVVFSLRLLQRRQDLFAGALLTVLLIKPTYVAPFLVLLLVQRRMRALAGFLGMAVVLAIGPLVVFGPAIVARYASALHLASEFKMIGYDATANQTVFGWLQMLGAPKTSTVIEAAIMGLGLAWLALQGRSARLDVGMAMAVVVALLCSPHVLMYDLSMWLLPVAVLLRCRGADSTRLVACLLAGYALLPIGYRLAFSFPFQLSVLLALALAWQLSRSGQREEERVPTRPTWLPHSVTASPASAVPTELGDPLGSEGEEIASRV